MDRQWNGFGHCPVQDRFWPVQNPTLIGGLACCDTDSMGGIF